MTFIKRSFASKSANKWLRYHQKKVEKRPFLTKIKIKKPLEKHGLFELVAFFSTFF
jgi:hypothetical protein